MKKYFIIVSLLVLVSISFSVQAKTKFKDVKSTYWAHDEIMFLTNKGLIKGLPNGNFKPDQSITRLQAITIILREKGITYFSGSSALNFDDVKKGDYGYEIISKAVELGIINGKETKDGKRIFDPNGKLTRAQMAKILSVTYNLKGKGQVNFNDVPSKSWSYEFIRNTTSNDITTGYPDGNFKPNNKVTRAQFSVMMARMLDIKFKTKDSTKPFNRADLIDMLLSEYGYNQRGYYITFNAEDRNNTSNYDVLFNLEDTSEIYVTVKAWDNSTTLNTEIIPDSVKDGLEMIIPSGVSNVYEIVKETKENGTHESLNVEVKYDGYRTVVISTGNYVLIKLVK